jgi:DNA-binding NarL/FixJ family response regulator
MKPLHEETGPLKTAASDADPAPVDPGTSAKRRTLLVVASYDSVSETLSSAIRTEFPWIAVEQVETVKAACRSFTQPVTLILVDALMLDEAETAAVELRRFHPDARAAIIEADGQRPRNSLADILESKLVNGVLPMNLQLDVWLSIVRLLLRGGEYFPADMFYPHDRAAQSGSAPKAIWGERAELTQREMEVLELVSRGLQNKSIAAELNLSEHTIKIHLHNIITKLRAHNRTEAAAWFRDRGSQIHWPRHRREIAGDRLGSPPAGIRDRSSRQESIF